MTSLKQRFINWQRHEPRCSLIMGDMINAVDEVASCLDKLIKDAEYAIADFNIDGSSQLDSAIKFYRGKIAAYKEVLRLLVGSEEKEKQKK